jgi:hypothetical protein
VQFAENNGHFFYDGYIGTLLRGDAMKNKKWMDGLTDHEIFQRSIWEDCKVTVADFRMAMRAGAFRSVRLIGGGVHFQIEARLRNEPKDRYPIMLVGTRSRKMREFRDPTAALELLKSMGATKVEVNIGSWYPERAKNLANRRPDMSERLKRAHAEARMEAERRTKLSTEEGKGDFESSGSGEDF